MAWYEIYMPKLIDKKTTKVFLKHEDKLANHIALLEQRAHHFDQAAGLCNDKVGKEAFAKMGKDLWALHGKLKAYKEEIETLRNEMEDEDSPESVPLRQIFNFSGPYTHGMFFGADEDYIPYES
ncbi:MAG: hypothetical protein Q9180_008223 [Flavoplaca navasiana]